MSIYDKKLPTLPLVGALTGAEELYCVQSGLDKRVTTALLAAESGGGGIEYVDLVNQALIDSTLDGGTIYIANEATIEGIVIDNRKINFQCQGAGAWDTPGHVDIVGTISYEGCSDLIFDGRNTTLMWKAGIGNIPMFKLSRCQRLQFNNFLTDSNAVGDELDSAFWLMSTVGGGQVMTNCQFRNLFINGGSAGGLQYGFRIGVEGDSNGDNNDFHTFDNVTVANYDICAYSIEQPEAKFITFRSSGFLGSGFGQYGISTALNGNQGGSFLMFSGGGGGNTIADFFLGAPDDLIVIQGCQLESSDRVLLTNGAFSSSWPVCVRDCRIATDDLNADNRVMIYTNQGPLTLFNNTIESFGKAIEIRLDPSFRTVGLAIGNSINSTLDNPFTVDDPTLAQWQVYGNIKGVDGADYTSFPMSMPVMPFSELPASGMMRGGLAVITDSTTAVLSAVVTGGGAEVVTAWYDGTNWRVVASDTSPSAGVGTPGGANTQVQFNDGGLFGGDADFTWNKTTNTMAFGAGATLDWGSGDVTLIHSLNTLTIGGASSVSIGLAGDFTAGTIQLGNLSDTTLSRLSAGVLGVEGNAVLTALTGQPLDPDLTSWALVTRAAGFDTFATTPSSANFAALVTGETGTGPLVFSNNPTFVGPTLGTPASGTLTNCTGLPSILAADEAADTTCFPAFFTAATGELGPKTNANLTFNSATGALSISGAVVLTTATGQPLDADLTSWAAITRAVGFDTFVTTPNSANLAALVTNETGSGALVFGTSPTLVTPLLGVPTSGTLTNCTGLPSVVVANEAADTTCFLGFFTAATGELGPKTNTNLTFDSAVGKLTAGADVTVVGTLAAPITQNSKSAAYTTVLSDAGKHIFHPTADNNARTFTIDSNANVPYPIGTTITFYNEINTVTIAITSDTLTLAGAGTTGSRTLAAKGLATAMKVGTTSWVINGTGLT